MRPHRTLDDIIGSLRAEKTVHAITGVDIEYSNRADCYVASTTILWGLPVMQYPYEYLIRSMGDTIEDALGNHAKELDDWQVAKATNIPKLVTQGQEFLMRGHWDTSNEEGAE